MNNSTSNQICRYYAQNAVCNNGENCSYLHVHPSEHKFINIGHSNGFGVPKSQRPCRNIATYGFCKYQHRGCEYNHYNSNNDPNHEHDTSVLTSAMQSTSLDGSPKSNGSTLSSSPVPSIELTPVTEHSPCRQRTSRDPSPLHSPRHVGPMQLQPVVPIPFHASRHAPMAISRSPPGPFYQGMSPVGGSSPVGSISPTHFINGPIKPNGVGHPHFVQDPNMHQEHVPGAYFMPNPVPHGPQPMFVLQGPASVSLSQPAPRRPLSFFIADDLKKELQRRSELMLKGTSPNDPETTSLPRMVHKYHNLYPLEDLRHEHVSKIFGVRTSTFKATSASDGRCYALKKIDGLRLHESAVQCVENWQKINHANVVPVREMFISSAFENVNSLYLAYDYFAGADTLEERFIRANGQNTDQSTIPEDILWSIIVQISSALRTIHAASLSCRVFASKVLISGKDRVRMNWTGIEELLNWDLAAKKNIAAAQTEDLVSFGKMLVVLCHKSTAAVQNLTKSLDQIEISFSSELKNFIAKLLSAKESNSSIDGVHDGSVNGDSIDRMSINDICSSITGRILDHLNRVHNTCDEIEHDLTKELENGRMFRLLVKLGFINERPEYEKAATWSETEDRYILKLFRDFVFHQVYEDGTPVIDFAHVIDALNKLDAGIDEKILLSTRDQKSVLIVSYKDLKRMAAHAFDELFNKYAQSTVEYAKQHQFRIQNQAAQINGRLQQF